MVKLVRAILIIVGGAIGTLVYELQKKDKGKPENKSKDKPEDKAKKNKRKK